MIKQLRVMSWSEGDDKNGGVNINNPVDCKLDSGASSEASSHEGPEKIPGFSFEETLLLLDWDDTFFPSSWALQEGIRNDNKELASLSQQEDLRLMSEHASQTLTLAKRLGKVVLVTNAERGWIELSCHRYLPELFPCIEGVKVLSARSQFGHADRVSPIAWKVKAFSDELNIIWDFEASQPIRRNILSVGDGNHEREAILYATKSVVNCRVKSLKLIDKPSVDVLCRQHKVLVKCLERIVNFNGNLDICIDKL